MERVFRFKKYITVFNVIFQDSVNYRANLFFNWILNLFNLLAPFVLWMSIFKEKATISGYSSKDMITYLLLVTIFGQLFFANGVENSIAEEIKSGTLSGFLVKPINYRLYSFFKVYSRRIFNFIILFIPLFIIILVLAHFKYFIFNMKPLNIILFILSGIMGIIISYLIHFCLGLIAFWLIECSALFVVMGTILGFLAGWPIPIDILFPNIQFLFKMIPFQYQLYFPIKIYLGNMSNYDMVLGLIIQFVWAVLMVLLSRLLWKAGIKKYTAVGAFL